MNLYEKLVGRTFGQYKLEELLGRGGMGAVYKGVQVKLQRNVAIKVIAQELVGQPGAMERFTREATTAATLEHANIVPVYDFGNEDNIAYVVMRLLGGGSLADRYVQVTKGERELPTLREIAQMLMQIGAALDYAHRRGVIHRDIKLGNIMFDDNGDAVLVDFGIAKLIDASTILTRPGAMMGTPLYMAPEQWRGEEITPATDQYAMGIVTYALVAGRMPFDGGTPFMLMQQHTQEAPIPIRKIKPGVPDSVIEVLNKALAKNPADRYETMTDFARSFTNAVRSTGEHISGFFAVVRPSQQKVTPASLPVAENKPEQDQNDPTFRKPQDAAPVSPSASPSSLPPVPPQKQNNPDSTYQLPIHKIQERIKQEQQASAVRQSQESSASPPVNTPSAPYSNAAYNVTPPNNAPNNNVPHNNTPYNNAPYNSAPPSNAAYNNVPNNVPVSNPADLLTRPFPAAQLDQPNQAGSPYNTPATSQPAIPIIRQNATSDKRRTLLIIGGVVAALIILILTLIVVF
jgi:serine/threonine protein kinase